MNPLWRKLTGDIRADRSSLILTIVALAMSLTGLGIMLDAYSVLIREISRNYRETTPAMATLELDYVDADLVTLVSKIPEVEIAERRRAVDARVRDGTEWRQLRLFIIDDFAHLQLNTFLPQEGAWPPATGTLLLERTAVNLMKLKTGDALTVRSPNGAAQSIGIAGFVHDAGLSPSEQERTIYGYATEATLRSLGESGGFDELRIRLTPTFTSRAAIAAKCQEIAAWLEGRGRFVHEVRIPPPGRHPHQGPMEAVLLSFIGFGGMALLLSAILLATTITALLAKQVKEIAILKAIGGSRSQIAFLYAALALGIGTLAVVIAVPASFAAAQPFIREISTLINFSVASYSVPHPVLFFQILIGLVLPVLGAAGPIYRAVNLPIRVGLADQGIEAPRGRTLVTRVGSRWSLAAPQWVLVWRNSIRHRLRFVLTVALLSASGAILMSAFNLKSAWLTIINRVYAERKYDVAFTLRCTEPVNAIESTLRDVPVIRDFESWQSHPVSFHTPGQAPVLSTYPDGGHGAFTIYGAPPKSKMISFPLLEGRWLREGDTDSVVLNHAARASRPALGIGAYVSLSVDGHARKWRVAGFIEEVGSAAAAYVPLAELTKNDSGEPHANLLRIATVAHSAAEKADAIRAIETALESRGLRVKQGLPLSELKTAMGAHITVLISTLLAAAVVMGTVAGLGLSTMLSMGVIERTREFGVLRAIGATPGNIVRMVVAEAAVLGLFGLSAAIPLSIAVSGLLGQIVGKTAFQIPLPLTFSSTGLILCSVALILLISAAAGLPARAAAQITVRHALDRR